MNVNLVLAESAKGEPPGMRARRAAKALSRQTDTHILPTGGARYQGREEKSSGMPRTGGRGRDGRRLPGRTSRLLAR